MFYLLILILSLIIEIILTCSIPEVKNLFFDHLSIFSNSSWIYLGYYIGVYIGLDIIQNCKSLFISLWANKRRVKLTKLYFTKDSKDGTRHQRIQEDIKYFVINQTIVYSEYFISSIIVIILIIQNFKYPILVAFSIAYSIICIIMTLFFKNTMINIEKHLQQIETKFRESLSNSSNSRIKWNNFFNNKLLNVIDVNIKNSIIKFNYGLCTRLQTGIMTLLPYIYLLPSYLHKNITLGDLMGQAILFQLLVVNMLILTQLFPQWMQAKASKERLNEML